MITRRKLLKLLSLVGLFPSLSLAGTKPKIKVGDVVAWRMWAGYKTEKANWYYFSLVTGVDAYGHISIDDHFGGMDPDQFIVVGHAGMLRADCGIIRKR